MIQGGQEEDGLILEDGMGQQAQALQGMVVVVVLMMIMMMNPNEDLLVL